MSLQATAAPASLSLPWQTGASARAPSLNLRRGAARAAREQRAEAIYDRLQAAAAEQRHDEVIVSFRALPPESVYVGLGRPAYEAALRPFVAAHLGRPRAAGPCAEFHGQLAAVLRLEPRQPAALRLQGGRCAERAQGRDG